MPFFAEAYLPYFSNAIALKVISVLRLSLSLFKFTITSLNNLSLVTISVADSGAILIAHHSGKVIFVDSNRIVIQRDTFKEGESGVDIYKLVKYQRTNQNTSNNQKALVKEGDIVISSDNADIKVGNSKLLKDIPVGTLVHNVELHPKRGGQLARSAGSYAQLMAK